MLRRSKRDNKRSHSAAAEDRNEIASKKIKISVAAKKTPARVTRRSDSKSESPSVHLVNAVSKPSLRSNGNATVVLLKLSTTPERKTRPIRSSKQTKSQKSEPVEEKQFVRKSEARSLRNNVANKKVKDEVKDLRGPKKTQKLRSNVSNKKLKNEVKDLVSTKLRNNVTNKKVKDEVKDLRGPKKTPKLGNNVTNKKVKNLRSSMKSPVKSEKQSLSLRISQKAKEAPAKIEIEQKSSIRASTRLARTPKKNYAHMLVFGTEVANKAIPKKPLIKTSLNNRNKITNAGSKRTPPTKKITNQIQNKVKRPQKRKNSSTSKNESPSKRRSTPAKINQRHAVKCVSRSVKRQTGIAYSEEDVQMAKNTKLFVSLEKLKDFEESDSVNFENEDVAFKTENNIDNDLANGKATDNDDADQITTENVNAVVNEDSDHISIEDAAVNGDADQSSKEEINGDADQSPKEEINAAVNGDADQNPKGEIDAALKGDANQNLLQDIDTAVNFEALSNATDGDQNLKGEIDAAVKGDADQNSLQDTDAAVYFEAFSNVTEDANAGESEPDITKGIEANNIEQSAPDNVNKMDDNGENSHGVENTINSKADFRPNLDAEEIKGWSENKVVSKEKDIKETPHLETNLDFKKPEIVDVDDSVKEGESEGVELVKGENSPNKQTDLRNELKSKEILIMEVSEELKSSTNEIDVIDLESDPLESVEDIVAKLHGSGSDTLDDDEKSEPQFKKTKKKKKETNVDAELKITYSKSHKKLNSDEEKQLNIITVRSEKVSTFKMTEEISDRSNEVETYSASLKAQILRRCVLNPNSDENANVSFSIVSYNVGGQIDYQELINEIVLLQPSIICLQDINESYFKISVECALRLHNYKGGFTDLNNGKNGLAMFYHASHFELIQDNGYKVNNLLNKEIQDMAISNLEKEQLLSFLESEFDQANIIKLKSKVNERELTVCSVNLASTNELIVGIQASTILSEVLRGSCKDYIICGTFYLEEDSCLHQFLQGGSMNIEDLEEVKKKFPGDDVTKTDLLRSLLEGLQQNCKDLKSSYSTILGHELCFHHTDKRKIKNSIWFSNNGLQIRSVLDAIAKSPLTDDVSESHISLKSEFQFI